LSTKAEQIQQQIEWRRVKVIELRARGLTQAEIARELQVSKQSISLDMKSLREQAKASISLYLTEHLPEQYQVCLCALDTILKQAYILLQESHDNKERIASLELFKDTHMTKLQLLSNAVTIDHALRYAQSKQQQQEQQSEQSEESEDQEAAEQDQEPEHTNTNTAAASGTGKHTVF
jgi:transcriptional regulator